MKPRYKVEATNGMKMYTAYEGASQKQAALIADMVRTTLVVGSGSGSVTLRINNIADVVFTVTDGQAFLALINGFEDASKIEVPK